MFYTGCTFDNTQRIGLAMSVDLYRWKRISDRPIINPDQYEWAFCPTQQGATCRDPHVFKHDDEYSLYYTAVTKDGLGCVARASSRDLLTWQDQGPVYCSDRLDHCESSNVQKLDDTYLLFLAATMSIGVMLLPTIHFTGRRQNRYRWQKELQLWRVSKKIISAGW